MATCVQLSVAAHAQPPHPDEAACIMLHLQHQRRCFLSCRLASSLHPDFMLDRKREILRDDSVAMRQMLASWSVVAGSW